MAKQERNKREKEIFKTSVIGIIANIVLSTFKAIVGFLSGSIAVVLDAINNVSDALSSIITIVGMKLASKPADKKHPLGHGRIEYFTSLVISVIVIGAGVASFRESLSKIINGESEINYTAISFVVMVVAIIVKFVLGKYVQKKGEQYNSDSLVASGKDALFDSIVTTSTLISGILYYSSNKQLNVDGYLGAIISVIIIKSGLGMILESVDEMLGKRVDPKIVKNIKDVILQHKEVHGVYDLFLDNYGPENYIGFVHIEIDDTMKAYEINKLTRAIQSEIFSQYGIALTIGIYAINTTDEHIIKISQKVKELLMGREEILQVHGLYVNDETKSIIFDIVIDFSVSNKKEYYKKIKKLIEDNFEGYTCDLQLDTDISLSE